MASSSQTPDTGGSAKYLLPAGTVGGGVSPVDRARSSVQVTLPANNKPTPFVSNRTHVTDFDVTFAIVSSFGGGPETVNHLFLPFVGITVPFESGTTIGAGANGDAGALILVESGVVRHQVQEDAMTPAASSSTSNPQMTLDPARITDKDDPWHQLTNFLKLDGTLGHRSVYNTREKSKSSPLASPRSNPLTRRRVEAVESER